MTADEKIPDRVSAEKDSPHHHPGCPEMDIAFAANGGQFSQIYDVFEFCVSEGWLKIYVRSSDKKLLVDGNGAVVTAKLSGTVKPYWSGEFG